MDTSLAATTVEDSILRQLEPQWSKGVIAASIAISLLGAFTSTQLMCQARASVHFSSVLVWTILGSLTFGFCSIWALHFVAMLACGLDLPIGIDVPLTIISSFLAVFFTFVALASDLLWERYSRTGHRRRRSRRRRLSTKSSTAVGSDPDTWKNGNKPWSEPIEEEEGVYIDHAEDSEDIGLLNGYPPEMVADPPLLTGAEPEYPSIAAHAAVLNDANQNSAELSPTVSAEGTSTSRPSSTFSDSRRSSSFMGSTHSSHGISNIIDIAHRSAAPAKNAFIATGEALYSGCTRRNIIKSFLWSLAISGMHYVGIAALRIPKGYFTLSTTLVILSALISWIVCLVGVILMSHIETHLAQQFLFSVVASTGVAAMHFTGMAAVTFHSHAPPSESRGYPPALATAIVTIAITTCIAANFLLAHVATISRNKLAEIVLTRKELWRTIAQKENAEQAAAARSDFIASASHEIRTPLHHLQGYSDLLSRTELTEEGRILLYAIQHATKTLSLITNNVLDWSKLERHTEAACRPISLDMRTVCESILMLLPNRDDADEVDVMAVVSPEVPHSLFLDETYIHRILMNLLSNALKFTRSGYILLLIEMREDKLIATVKDTGLGIPRSFLPKLFEPFTQAQVRGSQRGTGLGLSIIKQLLAKMQGTVEVESRHADTPEVSPQQTGSTFTITLPAQRSSSSQDIHDPAADRPSVAIFQSEHEGSAQGLREAWEVFGCDVVNVEEISDLSGSKWKYVWAGLQFFGQHPAHLRQLLKQDKWLVLVPYDTQDALKHFPEIMSAKHFITLQKPLIWHSFEERIAASREPTNEIMTKAVTFAPTVDIVDHDVKEKLHEEPASDYPTILLVEDNPINQRLGKRMLTALKYQVLTADDGEDALQQIVDHDAIVDAILMDQSMPRKDGVTATREIRAMEEQGILSRRRPIIAVTAVVSAEAQALFTAAGADDFLTKPLSLDRLGQTLATHLPAT